jgi:MoxR-like ATPase
LLKIVRATRQHPAVLLGASPRASLSLMMAGKAYAFIQQRDYVLPDDIKILSPYVLSHRIVMRPESRMDNVNAESVVKNILQQVHVPVALER